MPKYGNSLISETVDPIKPIFEDKAYDDRLFSKNGSSIDLRYMVKIWYADSFRSS